MAVGVFDSGIGGLTVLDALQKRLPEVPFVYFGVPDHADYHQPTDTVENIDQEFYREVSETVLDAVLLFDAS